MRTICAVWMTIAMAAAGCAARVPSPEPLPLDRAECAFCRMLVSSERGAAQIVSRDADTRFYDDVGCLAADWRSHAAAARAFVRAANGDWIDAAAAVYVRPAGSRTPMGSGLVAFATAADARAADAHAAALTFDDIVRGAGEPR